MYLEQEVAWHAHEAQQSPLKQRNRIEIMFKRLENWNRVATRYNPCRETFFSAIALAATVLFWL